MKRYALHLIEIETGRVVLKAGPISGPSLERMQALFSTIAATLTELASVRAAVSEHFKRGADGNRDRR